MKDFDITNHQSFITIHPLTPEARDWVALNLPDNFTGAVEPRYFAPIFEAICNEGFTWQ